MSKFSARQVANYVQSDGTICPECGSDQVEGGDLDSEGGAVIQRVACLECKAKWNDIYALVGAELTRDREVE